MIPLHAKFNARARTFSFGQLSQTRRDIYLRDTFILRNHIIYEPRYFYAQMPSMASMFLSPGRAFTMFFLLVLLSLELVGLVSADCECGYTTTVNSTSPGTYLFTDLIESDFLHIENITLDTDWIPQKFNMTPQAVQGPLGTNYTLSQVYSNPILDVNNWTGPGELGGDPGVKLTVQGGVPADGYVKSASIASNRRDMIWGSYRASIKFSPIAGTCAAFFWYFDDSQEIDMEFLSSQFNPDNGTFPVNLVLQANKALKTGFNSAGTGNYTRVNLPFDPTTAFHEYRFDYVPGSIVFYADSEVIERFPISTTPYSPGHLTFNHWSNGNILWTAGPPTQNSTISVGYVKGYFNSSESDRQGSWEARCKDPSAAGSICVIPDQKTAPDPEIAEGNSTSAQGNFFSDDPNQIVNQTVYRKSDASVLIAYIWKPLAQFAIVHVMIHFIIGL